MPHCQTNESDGGTLAANRLDRLDERGEDGCNPPNLSTPVQFLISPSFDHRLIKYAKRIISRDSALVVYCIAILVSHLVLMCWSVRPCKPWLQDNTNYRVDFEDCNDSAKSHPSYMAVILHSHHNPPPQYPSHVVHQMSSCESFLVSKLPPNSELSSWKTSESMNPPADHIQPTIAHVVPIQEWFIIVWRLFNPGSRLYHTTLHWIVVFCVLISSSLIAVSCTTINTNNNDNDNSKTTVIGSNRMLGDDASIRQDSQSRAHCLDSKGMQHGLFSSWSEYPDCRCTCHPASRMAVSVCEGCTSRNIPRTAIVKQLPGSGIRSKRPLPKYSDTLSPSSSTSSSIGSEIVQPFASREADKGLLKTVSKKGCTYTSTGQQYEHSEIWMSAEMPCVKCHCEDGTIRCTGEPHHCPQLCLPGQQSLSPGPCCETTCVGPALQNLSTNFANCSRAQTGQVYRHGAHITMPGSCVDQKCHCVNGRWNCLDFCIPIAHLPCAADRVVVWDTFCCPRCPGHLECMIEMNPLPMAIQQSASRMRINRALLGSRGISSRTVKSVRGALESAASRPDEPINQSKQEASVGLLKNALNSLGRQPKLVIPASFSSRLRLIKVTPGLEVATEKGLCFCLNATVHCPRPGRSIWHDEDCYYPAGQNGQHYPPDARWIPHGDACTECRCLPNRTYVCLPHRCTNMFLCPEGQRPVVLAGDCCPSTCGPRGKMLTEVETKQPKDPSPQWETDNTAQARPASIGHLFRTNGTQMRQQQQQPQQQPKPPLFSASDPTPDRRRDHPRRGCPPLGSTDSSASIERFPAGSRLLLNRPCRSLLCACARDDRWLCTDHCPPCVPTLESMEQLDRIAQPAPGSCCPPCDRVAINHPTHSRTYGAYPIQDNQNRYRGFPYAPAPGAYGAPERQDFDRSASHTASGKDESIKQTIRLYMLIAGLILFAILALPMLLFLMWYAVQRRRQRRSTIERTTYRAPHSSRRKPYRDTSINIVQHPTMPGLSTTGTRGTVGGCRTIVQGRSVHSAVNLREQWRIGPAQSTTPSIPSTPSSSIDHISTRNQQIWMRQTTRRATRASPVEQANPHHYHGYRNPAQDIDENSDDYHDPKEHVIEPSDLTIQATIINGQTSNPKNDTFYPTNEIEMINQATCDTKIKSAPCSPATPIRPVVDSCPRRVKSTIRDQKQHSTPQRHTSGQSFGKTDPQDVVNMVSKMVHTSRDPWDDGDDDKPVVVQSSKPEVRRTASTISTRRHERTKGCTATRNPLTRASTWLVGTHAVQNMISRSQSRANGFHMTSVPLITLRKQPQQQTEIQQMPMKSAFINTRQLSPVEPDPASTATTMTTVRDTVPSMDPMNVQYRDEPMNVQYKDEPMNVQYRDKPMNVQYRDKPINVQYRDEPKSNGARAQSLHFTRGSGDWTRECSPVVEDPTRHYFTCAPRIGTGLRPRSLLPVNGFRPSRNGHHPAVGDVSKSPDTDNTSMTDSQTPLLDTERPLRRDEDSQHTDPSRSISLEESKPTPTHTIVMDNLPNRSSMLRHASRSMELSPSIRWDDGTDEFDHTTDNVHGAQSLPTPNPVFLLNNTITSSPTLPTHSAPNY